jgi:hypothetical protein
MNLYFKAEGLTAIELWMLACILFVFGEDKEEGYIKREGEIK